MRALYFVEKDYELKGINLEVVLASGIGNPCIGDELNQYFFRTSKRNKIHKNRKSEGEVGTNKVY